MEKGIFIKTTIITSIIFILGIIFGLWIGQERVSALEQTTSALKDSVETAELQFALLDVLKPEVACNYLISTASDLGNKSDELASEVERYENSQKIDDTSFSTLKKQYTTTLIRDWVTVEKIKKVCEGDYLTIIYFYSNKDCDKCEDQGIVLTYIKDVLKENVMIFALDTDLGLTTVNSLRDSFGIDSYPSLVIENKMYSEYLSLEEINKILCSYKSDLSVC